MFLDDINLLVSNSVEFNKWSDTLKISNRVRTIFDMILFKPILFYRLYL